MITYILNTIFLLFIVIGLLVGVQSLIEWRRADLDDYERRFLNKTKNKRKKTYHDAEEETQKHD